MTLEEMQYTTEKQEFDRNSARIEATAIAVPMIAFANADGGLLAVGNAVDVCKRYKVF